MHTIKKFALLLIALLAVEQAAAAVVDIGKVKYSLSDATGEATAIGTATGLTDFNGLEIPDFITHNGTDYPVTTIARAAFQDKEFTGSLLIGNNVTAIPDYAFASTGFTGELTLGENIESIGYSAFGHSGFHGSLILPDRVKTIGEKAFYFSNFNGPLVLSENLTNIEDDAFEGCSGFTGSLTLPANLTSIGGYAFHGCSGFTGSLTLSANLTSIGVDAFNGCYGFTGSLTLPANLTSIGEYAFYRCSGFTGSLSLPYLIEDIGCSAFENCTGLNGTLNLGKIKNLLPSTFSGIDGFDKVITASPSVLQTKQYEYSSESSCDEIFSASVIYGATLYVQPALVEQYKASGIWGVFADIQPIEVTGMQFESSQLSMDKCGTAQAKLIVEPYYADITPQYASSDENVVTVSAGGVLTGVGVGSAIITATYNGMKAECSVTVSETVESGKTYLICMARRVQGHYVAVNEGGAMVQTNDINEKSLWNLTLLDDNAVSLQNVGTGNYMFNSDFTLSSEPINVYRYASPVVAGCVGLNLNSGLSTGDYTFLNARNNNTGFASWMLDEGSSFYLLPYEEGMTDEQAQQLLDAALDAAAGNQPEPEVPAESIVMNPIIGEVGGKIRMSATVLPANTTAPQITWSSSAVNVAAVDEDGTVWFNGAGTAVIKAACQGRETTMTVRVEAVAARGLNVFPAEAVGAVGNRFYLLALHDPENTTDKNVGWESSDPSVATVDGDGCVELKSIGRTVITATSGEHVAKCDVTVSDETTTLTAVASTGVVINIVEGGVDVENAPEGSRVIVSAVDGRVVNGMIVSSPEFHLDLAPGIYVLKIGTETTVKLLIH